MMHAISIKTSSQTEFIDITDRIAQAVTHAKISDGVALVFVPHTTAGVTINENADPSVRRDIVKELNKVIPFDDAYSHTEGNSAAHIKATLVGSSVSVIIEGGRLKLGTWQGIYFAEFDGPRAREVWIKIL